MSLENMTREDILARMDLAAKQDRERFFKVADSMTFQPKYAEHLAELADVKQEWRDMTLMENYPEIKFPLALPEWFPTVRFASCWDTDYVAQTLGE